MRSKFVQADGFSYLIPPDRSDRLLHSFWRGLEYHPFVVAFVLLTAVDFSFYTLVAMTLGVVFALSSHYAVRIFIQVRTQAKMGREVEKYKGDLINISADRNVRAAIEVAEVDPWFQSAILFDEIWKSGGKLVNDGKSPVMHVLATGRDLPTHVFAARFPRMIGYPSAYAYKLGSSIVLHREYPAGDRLAETTWLFHLYHELVHTCRDLPLREIKYSRAFETLLLGCTLLATQLGAVLIYGASPWILIATVLATSLLVFTGLWTLFITDTYDEANADISAVAYLSQTRTVKELLDFVSNLEHQYSKPHAPRNDSTGYFKWRQSAWTHVCRQANFAFYGQVLKGYSNSAKGSLNLYRYFQSKRFVRLPPHESIGRSIAFPSLSAVAIPALVVGMCRVFGTSTSPATVAPMIVANIVVFSVYLTAENARDAVVTSERAIREMLPTV